MDRDDNHRIQNHVGLPVQGHDFFGRHAFISGLLEDLETANLLLLAPRRVGKTSVLKKVQLQVRATRSPMAYVDVSDVINELGFVEAIIDAVARELGEDLLQRLKDSPVGSALAHVKEIGAGPIRFSLETPDSTWRSPGEQLAAILKETEQDLVVAIDELPVMVLELLKSDDGASRVRQFLNWFRKLRIGHSRVRWVLAGSIGLDTVAQLHNLQATINDLTVISLDAFDPATADRFLERLGWSYSIPLSEEVRADIIERLGWPLPYFLQLVFYELRQSRNTPTTDAVAQALETLVTRRRSYFENWYQRLEEQLGPVRGGHAELLLSSCCREEGASRALLSTVLMQHIADPRQRKKALDFTLWVLVNDGYLVESGGRFRFRSPLLRAWWERYHNG